MADIPLEQFQFFGNAVFQCNRTNAITNLNAKVCNISFAIERFHASFLSMRIKTPEMLGELVRDQRKMRGWSQTSLAEKVGVSRLWISQFENGKASVELGLVLKTLRELNLGLTAVPIQINPFANGPI